MREKAKRYLEETLGRKGQPGGRPPRPVWPDSPVQDARQMLRGAEVSPEDPQEDAEEKLVRFWKHHLLQFGLRLTEDDREVPAYINQGRWVADCPECNGGMAVYSDTTCCLDCGHVYTVDHPHKATAEAVVTELGERPRDNRNWRPQDGEDLEFIRDENKNRRP